MSDGKSVTMTNCLYYDQLIADALQICFLAFYCKELPVLLRHTLETTHIRLVELLMHDLDGAKSPRCSVILSCRWTNRDIRSRSLLSVGKWHFSTRCWWGRTFFSTAPEVFKWTALCIENSLIEDLATTEREISHCVCICRFWRVITLLYYTTQVCTQQEK